ncbi:MAG: hypothetical protein NVS1B16_07190 [Pseudarthrobacter sp.]
MAINYKLVDANIIGAPALNTAGDTTQRMQLGTILRGSDYSTAAYGDGEFRYVKFTGTVAAGDFVVFDNSAFTAVQASQTTIKGNLGVSMAAQASGNYGWVMIRGTHDGANVATGVTAGTALGLSTTAGRAQATSTGFKIDNGYERVITSASNVGTVELDWPSWTGNG